MFSWIKGKQLYHLGTFLVHVFKSGFLPPHLKGLHSCKSQGHDDNASFLSRYISWNGALGEMQPGRGTVEWVWNAWRRAVGAAEVWWEVPADGNFLNFQITELHQQLQLLFSYPIFSVSLFFNQSQLPPPPPFHQQWLDQHVSFVRVMRFLIIEDGASRSCRVPQTSKWPRGRTDMLEPDMRKNTGLHILALGCACNTCFPCCFIHCFLDLAKYFLFFF